MEERVFKEIIIEPSKIYTKSKFKLKIKLEDNSISRLLTEDNFVLNTENNEELIVEV
nr:MAG TPA: hypothetical protein [Caudoviricetes sp.]